jgi:hypothetical protein
LDTFNQLDSFQLKEKMTINFHCCPVYRTTMITINLPHLHRDELIKFVEKEGGDFVFSVLPGTYEIEVKK